MVKTLNNKHWDENRDILIDAVAQLLPEEKPKVMKSQEIATRSRSIDFISSFMNILPNPDPILKKKNVSVQVYEALLYDGRVKAVVNSRKSKVRSMEWDVVGEDQPEEILDFYRNIFKSYNMTDLLNQILDAFLYGYKPIEILWASDGNKTIPLHFIPKPSEWFIFDDENQLRMLTNDSMITGIPLPPNRFIIATNESTYKNPYGVAVLSACLWPVTFRKNGLMFWTQFVEKYGAPFLLAHAEAGAAEERINEIANMLEDMVQDAIAVVPEGYKVELLEAGEGKGKSDSLHKAYLDYMNMEISVAVLSTNLTTEVQGGSLAASQSHMQVREDIIESDAAICEQAFNELIRLTHSINFRGEAPRFKLFSEEKIDVTRADRDKKLSETGVKFTKSYYERAYNLTEDDFELTEPTLSLESE